MTEYERALSCEFQRFLTPARIARFAQVLEQRTELLTVVLVDLFHEHNGSAILRTCEAFGIQTIHVVETTNQFSTQRDITMGSDRWLSLKRYKGDTGLEQCCQELRSANFLISAMVVSDPANEQEICKLDEVKLTPPARIALVLGNERDGLPASVAESADLRLTIPMFGFVESLNVSVAAALAISSLSTQVRQRSDWQLSEARKEKLLLDWSRRSVANADAIEKRFRAEHPELLSGSGKPTRKPSAARR